MDMVPNAAAVYIVLMVMLRLAGRRAADCGRARHGARRVHAGRPAPAGRQDMPAA